MTRAALQTTKHTPTQVGLVIYFYVASYNTVKNLVHRHLKTTQAHPGLALVSARIRNRLFKYTLLFCVMWGLGETAHNDDGWA